MNFSGSYRGPWIRKSPISHATQTRDERLQGEAKGGISFDGQGLQGVEELPALAGEEAVGGEACDRGHGACKFIG